MTITHNALGERAMLVSLSVSIWSARKHDARISDKVAAEHGADRSMGRYAKHLIPREPADRGQRREHRTARAPQPQHPGLGR